MKTRTSWDYLYWCLVGLRLAGSFLPGYVHPDELFQSGQELWHGLYPESKPWEFREGVRSILPLRIGTEWPLYIGHKFGVDKYDGAGMWWIPKLWTAVCSLVVDVCLYRLVHQTSGEWSNNHHLVLLWFASSWPTLIFMNRTFSNTWETFWLALLLHWTFGRAFNKNDGDISLSSSVANDLVVGAICAIGIFTRFTFVIFAAPVMVGYFCKIWLSSSWVRVTGSLMCTFTALLIVAAVFVIHDTTFYVNDVDTDIVVAPLRGFLYNTQVDNLQHHGLHPYWTHVVVNLPLLFGPLTFNFYRCVLKTSLTWIKTTITIMTTCGKLRRILSSNSTTAIADADHRSSNKIIKSSSSVLHTTCVAVVVFGLLGLSVAPHQEPRFLLPLTVPLHLLLSLHHQQSSEPLPIPHTLLLWNAVPFFVYGVLHQSGVVRSLLDRRQEDENLRAIVFYRTYPAPSFLLHRCCNSTTFECPAPPLLVNLNDDELANGVIDELGPFWHSRLNEWLPCCDDGGGDAACFEQNDKKAISSSALKGEVHLLAPGSVDVTALLPNGSFLFEPYNTYPWHLSTEDIPSISPATTFYDLWTQLSLVRYRLRCS